MSWGGADEGRKTIDVRRKPGRQSPGLERPATFAVSRLIFRIYGSIVRPMSHTPPWSLTANSYVSVSMRCRRQQPLRQFGVTPPVSTDLPKPAEVNATNGLMDELRRQNTFENKEEGKLR
jgi:hypothetical protein